MTQELVSIREAAELLGVSQLRVRELIKKNKLEAQKVAGDGGERWAIVTSSAQAYLKSRPEQETNGSAQPLPALLAGLEKQLERIRGAISELSKAQAYLEGLKAAERAVLKEITTLRPAPKPEPVEEVPVAEKERKAAEEPEKTPTNGAKKPKAPKATASLGQALEDAGVAAATPKKRAGKTK